MAVVLAETLDQAEYAASLVRVEYEAETPAVSFDALKAEAAVPSDILGEPPEVKIGDAGKGFTEAEVTVDNIYRTPRYNHNAIEPHATIAAWNEDGSLTVFESTQVLTSIGICSPEYSVSNPKKSGDRAVCRRRFRRQRWNVEQYGALRGGGESRKRPVNWRCRAKAFTALSAVAPSQNSASLWERTGTGD